MTSRRMKHRLTFPTDVIMQDVTVEHRPGRIDPEFADGDARGMRGWLRGVNPSLAALVTWIICLPVAFVGARLGPADPFRLRVAMIPVVVLIAGVVVAGVV